MTASGLSRRPARFLDALPAYFGGKRRLLGCIARVLPSPATTPVLVDAFLGGGAVALWAKRRGYRVVCNDIAVRSAVVGRALIENDRIRLTREDIVTLFVPERESPGFVERAYGGEVLPVRHARFLDGALEVARAATEPRRSLLLLLLLQYVLRLRPMGNFGAKSIVRQMDEGRWEDVNPLFLRDHLARRVEGHPWTICEELRERINAGVFGNGHRNECHQGDVFEFLATVEGDAVYLDPPYAATSAYETALRPLDSILAGEPVNATPSPFSGRQAIETLDRLLAAAAHIPHLVLSYGNAMIGPEALEALVARHRHDVHIEAVEYAHLAGLAGEESKRKNRELLVRAGRRR